jgi:hypothetical protein
MTLDGSAPPRLQSTVIDGARIDLSEIDDWQS